MAKKDITKTKDINSPGSRSEKRAEREKGLLALQKAQLIPRKVIFLKQGEGQFTREMKTVDNTSDMLISRSAAAYLMISYHAFTRRILKLKVPFVTKKGNHRYYKTSDLDKFKTQILNA